MPSQADRDKWEQLATLQDAASEKFGEMGALGGAPSHVKDEPTTVSDWPVDSRGGTRTRDPSIMSSFSPPEKDPSEGENAE